MLIRHRHLSKGKWWDNGRRFLCFCLDTVVFIGGRLSPRNKFNRLCMISVIIHPSKCGINKPRQPCNVRREFFNGNPALRVDDAGWWWYLFKLLNSPQSPKPNTKQITISQKVQNSLYLLPKIFLASSLLYQFHTTKVPCITTITMPLGFAGFPRDPTSGKPVGIAQSFLSSPSKKDDSKRSQDTITSWKAQEAARDQYRSTDTLPVYQEKNSSNQN